MNIFSQTFNLVLYQPLFNALVWLYLYLPGRDFGVAVIVLTLLIKLVLYPVGSQAIKSQKAMAKIQPKLKELQQKFKNDKQNQTKAMMELYKQEKVNPLSGCLTILIQLPILIGLFQVFRQGFDSERLSFLYSFMPHLEQINTSFLGLMDLANPSPVLAVLTGIVQFVQMKMVAVKPTSKGPSDFSQMMQKQMLYFLPFFAVFFLWRLPAALALYWLVSTLFTILQQYIILKKHETA